MLILMSRNRDDNGSTQNQNNNSEGLSSQDVTPNFSITGPAPQKLEKTFNENGAQVRSS